jgi:hypothetical protein
VVGDRFVFVRGLSERYSNTRLNNASISTTENMNLRLGVSQTVSRPSFRELSEFEFTDIGGHAIIGNPDLKRPLSKTMISGGNGTLV